MPEKDQPPRRIWLDDEELEAHFDRLREKYGRDSDDDRNWEDVPQFEENELTKGLR